MTKWCKRIDDGTFASGMYQEGDPAADPAIQARVLRAIITWNRSTATHFTPREFSDGVAMNMKHLSDRIERGELTLQEPEEPHAT